MKVEQRTEELVRNNSNLQKEINERLATERKLKETQNQLLDSAHKAGMAEIAADSLHNVGNILNSVKTSAYIIKESMTNSPMESYSQTCNMVRQNEDNLVEFLFNDQKGVKTIQYFLALEKSFKSAFQEVGDNIDRLNRKIDAISDVIVAQQSYASSTSFSEEINIIEIIEDSLRITQEFENMEDIEVIEEFDSRPNVTLQKSKLLHILVNLFKNAILSMQNDSEGQKRLIIKTSSKDNSVYLEVSDTGEGIPEENLQKIFAHGFTTRKSGFGFGLHSCANYVSEMGGTISAESDGKGKGARFLLKFPLDRG